MNSIKLNCIRVFTVVGLTFASFTTAVPVKVAEAPGDNLEMTLAAIKAAGKSIYLNAYELDSDEITSALLDRINAGVEVQILEEGQPVGGLTKEEKSTQTKLVDAINTSGNGHFYLMTSKASKTAKSTKRRYRYDHAKYAIIDEKQLLVGSENYSPTGNPAAGKLGNRGWEVFINDDSLVKQYQSIFMTDSDTSYGDVEELTDNKARIEQIGVAALGNFMNHMLPPSTGGDSSLMDALPGFDATGVARVTSPDSSMQGLTDLLNNAKTTIDIELMTFAPGWAKEEKVSPLYTAVLAAAKRGVQIRVLLNDDTVFGTSAAKSKNLQVVNQLNDEAKSDSLQVEARTADVKAMGVDYIHNKGVLVDGNQTLISSINWDENSVEHNREAAVVIDCADVNQHYMALFNSDWNNSSDSKN